MLDGLVEDDAGAEVALEDGSRRLARAEAGDAGPPGEGADGIVDGAVETLGRQLDLELDGRLGGGGSGDLHRPRSIGGDRRSGGSGRRQRRVRAGGRGGRRERGRTSTPLTRHRLLRPARLPFRHSPAGSQCNDPSESACDRRRRDSDPERPRIIVGELGLRLVRRRGGSDRRPRSGAESAASAAARSARAADLVQARRVAGLVRGEQEVGGRLRTTRRGSAGRRSAGAGSGSRCGPSPPAWRRPRSRARGCRGPCRRRSRACAASCRSRRAASTSASAPTCRGRPGARARTRRCGPLSARNPTPPTRPRPWPGCVGSWPGCPPPRGPTPRAAAARRRARSRVARTRSRAASVASATRASPCWSRSSGSG